MMAAGASPAGIILWMEHAGRIRSARLPLALGLAIAGVAFLVLAAFALDRTRGWGFDVEAYLWAAQRVSLGESPYWEYTLEGPFNPGPWGLYLYAPPLAVGFVPLAGLSQPVAILAWYLLRVGLLALGCWALPVRPAVRLLVLAVGAVSQPVIVDLVLGNVSVLVFFLLALVWRGLDRPWGAIPLALALSIRPTLGIVLLWSLIRRRLRVVAATLLAGLVLVLVTIPVVGFAGYLDWLTVLGNVSQVAGVSHNLDLASTLLRLDLAPEVATAGLYAGYLIAIVAVLLSLRRDRDTSFIVTTMATLLLAPLLWDHYLVALLLPAAFLAERGRTWGLALPLLAWLPAPLIPIVAIAATLLPFLGDGAGRPGSPGAAPAVDRPWRLLRGARPAA